MFVVFLECKHIYLRIICGFLPYLACSSSSVFSIPHTGPYRIQGIFGVSYVFKTTFKLLRSIISKKKI